MKKSIVWQLLRRNISVAQLAGYAIANLVGLAIVLTAVQFYRDVTEVWNSEDSFIRHKLEESPRRRHVQSRRPELHPR